MAELNRAFRVRDGISFNDNVYAFEGTENPTVGDGIVAPLGSLFIRHGATPELYQKTGALDTDWTKIEAGAALSHNSLDGLEGGDVGNDDFYHLDLTTYGYTSGLTGNIQDQVDDVYDRLPYIAAGPITDVVVTDNGSGLVDLSSIDVYLHSDANNSSQINKYTIPAVTGLQLVANTYTYVTVIYNGGSPIYSTTTNNTTINHSNILNIVQLYWENLNSMDDLHTFKTGKYGLGLSNKLAHRLIHTERFGYQEGLMIGEYGTRNISIDSGVVWYDGLEIDLDPVATATIGQEFHYYYHSSGNWQVSLETQYSSLNYDNGTNLIELSSNRYAVNWVYKGMTGYDTYVVSGTGDFKLEDAVASGPPDLPSLVSKQAVLVGRIITEKSQNTATEIDSAFSYDFNSAAIIHNDTLGLQGGTTNEYYHLDLTQHTNLTSATPSFQDITITDLNRDFSEYHLDMKMATGIPDTERGKFKVAFTYSAPNLVATISFVGANTSASYYINGRKFEINVGNLAAYTGTETASAGTWFFYIQQNTTDEDAPVITLTKTPWRINDPDVLLFNAYFDTGTNSITWVGNERHTAGRDIYNHARNHYQGAVYKNGFIMNHYNGLTTLTNTDNNFGRAVIGINGGAFFDEDIENIIVHTDASISSTTAVPATDWNKTVEQFLGFEDSAIAGTNATTMVFLTSRTLITGQAFTVFQGNTTTIRGTGTVTTGGTASTFTVSSVTGMTTGDSIIFGARIPIYYVSAVSSGVYTWSRLATGDFLGVTGGAPYTTANISSGVAQFNNATAGGFSNITAGRFYPVFILATNFTSEPVIAVLGQAQSTNTTLSTALNEAGFQFQNILGISNLGIQELVPVGRVTFEYNTTGSFSTSRIRIRDYIFINTRVATASGTVIGGSTTTVSAAQTFTDTSSFGGLLSTSDTSVQLALDTLDNVVHNTLTSRDVAGNHAKLIPTVDSVSAIQIMKADGTTAVVQVDTASATPNFYVIGNVAATAAGVFEDIVLSGTDFRQIVRTIDSGKILFAGGSSYLNGAYFSVTGKDNVDINGKSTASVVVGQDATSVFDIYTYDGVSVWTPRLTMAGSTGHFDFKAGNITTTGNLVAPVLRPSADGATSVKITKADGTTGIVTINSTSTPPAVTIDGTLNINGNIVQNGASYETHAEQIYTEKDLIITRDGAIAGLGVGEYTGIQATLYDGVNSGQLVFDKDGWARVGDTGTLLKIATIEETPTNGYYAYWDSTAKTLKFNPASSIVGSIAHNDLGTIQAAAAGITYGHINDTTQTIAGSKTFSSAPTFSTITAGSILFAGTSGLVSQENTKLFWDATNDRLGIGTGAPTTIIDIVGNDAGGTMIMNMMNQSVAGNSLGGFQFVTGNGTVYTWLISDSLGTSTAGEACTYLGSYSAHPLNLFVADTLKGRFPTTTSHYSGSTGNGATFELSNTATQAADRGASISFGGRYNGTAGLYYQFGKIHGVKANATSGNYQGKLILQARPAGVAFEDMITMDGGTGAGLGTITMHKTTIFLKTQFTPTAAGTTAIDWSTADLITRTSAANETLTFSNPRTTFMTLIITASGANRTITFPTALWDGEGSVAAKAIVVNSGLKAFFTIYHDGSSYYISYSKFHV